MGQAAKAYSTADAIADYLFWKSGDAACQEFYRNAPPPRPYCVHDYDNTPHSEARQRLERLEPASSLDVVLMLEAVICEIEDDGLEISTSGLRALQARFEHDVRRDVTGQIDVAAVALPLDPGLALRADQG